MLEAGREPRRQARERADPLDGLPVVLLALVDEEVRRGTSSIGVSSGSAASSAACSSPPALSSARISFRRASSARRPSSALRASSAELLQEEREPAAEGEDGEGREDRSRGAEPPRAGDGRRLGPEEEADEADDEEREEEAAREAGDGPRGVADLEREDRRPDGEDAQPDDGSRGRRASGCPATGSPSRTPRGPTQTRAPKRTRSQAPTGRKKTTTSPIASGPLGGRSVKSFVVRARSERQEDGEAEGGGAEAREERLS